jgi:hypothetical protein
MNKTKICLALYFRTDSQTKCNRIRFSNFGDVIWSQADNPLCGLLFFPSTQLVYCVSYTLYCSIHYMFRLSGSHLPHGHHMAATRQHPHLTTPQK